jgi:hypothetical protein
MPVDWIAVCLPAAMSWLYVRDDLVAKQVEINPLLRAAAFRTAKDGSIEVPCGCEIIDREGDVEGAKFSHASTILAQRTRGQPLQALTAGPLAAIEAVIVTAQVSIAEGVLVDAEWPKRRVIARRLVVGPRAPRAEWEALGGIARTVTASGLKAIAFGQLNDRRNLCNGWWRRWRVVRGVGAAKAGQQHQRRQGYQGSTLQFHPYSPGRDSAHSL